MSHFVNVAMQQLIGGESENSNHENRNPKHEIKNPKLFFVLVPLL